MNEIVKMVSEKTGLSPEMSKTAVDTVIGFLKSKLPPAIAGQLDGVISGGGAASALGHAGDLAKGLGGMFK